MSSHINNDTASSIVSLYKVIKLYSEPRKRICLVNTVSLSIQNSRWDHFTFRSPPPSLALSLSTDVKLSRFTPLPHPTVDGSHIKLRHRQEGLSAVWGVGGNI